MALPTPDELPPAADAEGAAEFLRGRMGAQLDSVEAFAALAADYARAVQIQERAWWMGRDTAQEAAVTLCERGKLEAAALIEGHNARAAQLNAERR